MKYIEKEVGESWREYVSRLVSDALGEDMISDVNEPLELFDMATAEIPEEDAAWDVLQSYGLLSEMSYGSVA